MLGIPTVLCHSKGADELALESVAFYVNSFNPFNLISISYVLL